MKTKLFTTNSFFVMIMTLVLAMGVQDPADAIDRLTRSAGDLQTVTVGNDYQIRFTVGLQSPRRGSGHTDHVQTPSADVTDTLVADKTNKTTYYEDDYDPDNPDTTARGYQSETQVTYDTAHDYEQEQITITVAGGGFIKKVGSYDVPADTTSLVMYESTHNSYSRTSNPHQRLSGSVTLTLTAPTAAAVGITIDPATDRAGHTEPPDLVFTVYVVGPINATGTTAVADTDGVRRVSDQSDPQINGDFTFVPADHQPVNYSVEGSGRLYVSLASDRKSRATNNLFTSSSAPVFLDATGGSSKVTAHIAGASDTAKVLYVFSGARLTELPQIQIQSGDGQTGAPSGRLDDYFEVKVTDGRRRPISGLPVTFATSSPTGAMFIPVSGTSLYIGTDGTPEDPDAESIDAGKPTITVATTTTPAANDEHHVQTDRNGVAKIYYQLSSTSGPHTITAEAHGIGISTTLTATASSTARARLANLEIVSGNNQRGEKGKYLKDDLVVIVRSLAGHRVQNAIIQFRTTTGTLVPAEGTDQPDTLFGQTITLGSTLNPTSGQQIFVETGPDGEAGVSYNVGQVIEARNVIAEIREEAQTSTQYDFAIDRVVFNINGTSSSTREPPPEPPEDTGDTATLTVTPTTITGPPGSTRDIRITTSGAAQISNLLDFSVAGGSVSQSSGLGTFTSTLTLPSQDGTYTLDVTSGTQRQPVTVTVSSTAAQDTSTGGQIALEVPLSGAPNSSQSIRVTVLDENGSRVPDVDVTLAITSGGGTFSNSRVTTGAAGTVTSTLTLGSTPGTDYFVTASASGYDPVERRISITGTAPPADTPPADTPPASTAGDPSLISIDGEAIHRGTIDQELDAPLVVEVLDSQGRRVSNARVIFRVRTGQGRLSQLGNGRATSVRTNAQGLARADYTPMSARSTVEAEVRGVTETVTFTIITDGSAPQTGTSDGAPRSYQVRDEIPISLEGTLTFSGSRTLNGVAYTCVGSGECVVSFGTVTRGQIQAAPAKAPPQQEYKVRDEIPISLDDTLSFTGRHSVNGTIYTCVGPGECVVSYGTVVKGQIRVAAASPTTTPRSTTEINPEVLIGAGNRPPMLWVDGGKIYALVGAEVQEFIKFKEVPATSESMAGEVEVKNVRNIAIGGGKIYWTEETGESAGTINAANLNGSGAKELTAIKAIPTGIAVDTNASKLFWTNLRGRIQSANLDGSGIRNVLQNLPGPPGGLIDIAVARRNLYWTQYNATSGTGSIGIVNPTVRGTPKYISTDNTPMNLVITENKLYWTEMSTETTGTINSANLNGSGAKQLASIQAVPVGIAVDTARSKLYWTNSRGRIQSANLDGSRIQNVVDGLGMPGDMVLSNSIKAPTTTAVKSTTTAGKNKYDLNGDGTVDNTDVDVLIVAISGGVTSAKYDVNGDGKVDFNDIVAVRANRSGGAASAPTLLGRKFSALEVDRLQEQIDLLIATGDRSPAAMQTLIYLQQLIAMARPEKTQLLANFPNPFNPETWMPYELATDTDVRITIYNAQGVVIRTLQLGQQSAGYYTDRERAAHWDGRNALGEQVASGIYFYQLETDEMSSLRKMVILK